MAASNAVPQTAVSRTLGYALDYVDLQTAQANLPVKVLVLSDKDPSKTVEIGEKIISATAKEVKEEFGKESLGYEVMTILDELKASQYIDVVYIDTTDNDLKDAITAALGDIWYNIIVNPFGNNLAVHKALKEVNGIPSESGGTGRWNALEVKPFIAISGNRNEKTASLEATDLTNIIGTAPHAFEDSEDITEKVANAKIAASYAFLAYSQFSTKPYLDIAGKALPFIEYPSDLNIGDMSDYNKRDNYAKNGICTVTLDTGKGGYVVQDFITGRRISDQADTAKDWRFVRDIFVDFNIAYKYQILQARTLMNKVIVSDNEIIQSDRKSDSIRLKTWKAAVINFFTQMTAELFMTDAEFSVQNLLVELSGTNPKRINTQFAYKRTSTVNIASTTAYVGFAFGENA